ncbi:MarR family winged helix-turn-helix transcriptional regulator [Deinococcus radiotolerans]|nr:MarR family transcriptional regulator [Deinococcus radiotolerans]
MTTDPRHLEQSTYLTLQVLALRLKDEVELLLKPEGLSVTQYNVLRILRGAGAQALTCGEVASQLLNKDPDVTRLLDRMQKQGLVERLRSEQDRRVLLTRLTPQGRATVDQFDAPVAALHRQQFRQLTPDRLALLLDLLQEIAQQDTD